WTFVMSFHSSAERQYNELSTVGIAIRGQGQLHIGVLHRIDDDVQLCHLRFHHDLVREPPEEGYYWEDCQIFCGGVDRTANGRFFAISVAETANDPNIPYGFAFEENCFGNDGTYHAMKIGQGLTCATFIIALFHCAGYPIVKLDTWKRRSEDSTFQNDILKI